jgi:hypothetical protein
MELIRWLGLDWSVLFFFKWRNSPYRAMAYSVSRFHDHIQLDTPHSVGLLWTSDQPDAETATITTHNKHKARTCMPSARIEPAIPASERPQTHALDSRPLGWAEPFCTVLNVKTCIAYEVNVSTGCTMPALQSFKVYFVW